MVLIRPGQNVTASIQPPTADLTDLLGAVQIRAYLAEFVLGLFALGDVCPHGHGANHFAVPVMNRRARGLDETAPAARELDFQLRGGNNAVLADRPLQQQFSIFELPTS